MVSDLQKRTAQAIVNIYETGRIQGDYGQVTVLAGDPGHLTYGRSQTTLASGNLHLLIEDYCQCDGAVYSDKLKPYLSDLEKKNTRLDTNPQFKELLREAGGDPVMHTVQDQFFDRIYWHPAVRYAENYGIQTALGTSVIYDSKIQGSLRKMTLKTIKNYGKPPGIGEQLWIAHYVETRKKWLMNYPNPLLRKTVYRMEEFEKLIQAGKWNLRLQILIRGVQISKALLLQDTPFIRAWAGDGEDRVLKLQRPYLKGNDIKEVQKALNRSGFSLRADGVFGKNTAAAVREFQKQKSLKVDGIVGNATRAILFHSCDAV